MKKIKKPISVLLAMLMVVSLFMIVPFTAGAATTAITDFLDCTSGSAEGYFTYSDHFYKIEWTGINTNYTHSVCLAKWYDDLAVNSNGQDSTLLTIRQSPSGGRYWSLSDITSLTAGQSSSGYSNALLLAEGSGGTDYKKVCTVTCVAANAPAWNWSNDASACTATFVCADESSLSASVNAAVSTEGNTATATTTFNGITYTSTTTIPDFYVNEAGDTYTIRNEAGWNTFCDLLADNAKGYFDNKTVQLGADISVTRMAGGSYHDFTGTFDGQGHTLTISYGTFDEPVSNDDKTAPFRNAESGCVIKNLRTAGTIYTSKKYAGGFIGTQYGTVKIENCRSSVTINSLTAGDGTHGGFVGNNGNGSDLTIDGCVFDGKILSAGETATTSCSGFVGYKHNSGTITLTNCVYDPAALEDGETEVSANSATFVRNGSAGNNCYYTRTLGDAQGKQTHTITADNDVTLALCGDATAYNVSGITAYENNSGLQYNDQTYAGENDAVTLTLGYTRPAGYAFTGYTASAGTLADNVLTMPAENVTIGAGFEQALYTVTVAPTTHGSAMSIKSAAHYGEYVALIMMPASGYYTKSVYINGNVLEPDAGGYSFDMPDEDVTVTVVFAKKPVSVTYLDENGTAHMVQAVPLDPSMTTLEEGWYVVNSNITYTEPVTFTGKVNLILGDNRTMSVGTEEAPITSKAAIGTNRSYTLTIYGQSGGTGTLKAYSSTKTAVSVNLGTFVQNGGNVILRSAGNNAHALLAYSFTLNGGNFNSSCSGSDSYGLCSAGTITLGYRSAQDSIQVSSIHINYDSIFGSNSKATIAKGKTFTDGTNFYDSNTASATLEALTNVTLTPVAYDVTVSDCTNGSVTAQAKAAKDETVTLTVNPDYGYAVTGVTVNGTAIEPVNGVYSFTMPAQNVTVSAEFEEITQPYIAGASLTLKGDIDVNVYIQPSADLDTNTAYVMVYAPGDTSGVRYDLKDLEKNPVYGYKVSCLLTAQQMGESVTVHLFDGSGKEQAILGGDKTTEYNDGYSYSPKDYFATVKNGGDTYSDALKTLVNTMQNYGEYAREYFGNKTAAVCEPEPINDVTADDLEEYALSEQGTAPTGVSYYGSSLILKSKTSLRFYFDSAFTDSYTVTDSSNNAVAFNTGNSNGRFYIEVPDIAAKDLDKAYTIAFGDYRITSSALTYAYNALSYYSDNAQKTALCNLVKSLYKYNTAAKAVLA